MGMLGQDVGRMARAQLIAEEYARASDSLESLRSECEEEERILRTMRRTATVLAALCGLLLLVALVMMCTELSSTYPLPMLIVIGGAQLLLGCAVPAAMVVFAPAGFIGLWRAIKRSQWSVWGGWVIMLAILFILFFVPVAGGVFFYIGQVRRVKRLEAEVLVAEKRFDEARAAIN